MRLSYRILILAILLPCCVGAQQFQSIPSLADPPVLFHQSVLQQLFAPESDCTNNIDDNGNGLTDLEDFHCYFNPDNFYGDCKPSKVIWGSTSYGVYFVNVEKGTSTFFPTSVPSGFTDLSWSSDGKLYASGTVGNIYSIDPHTFEATIVGDIEGHYFTNGMTGDNNGNLIVTSFYRQYSCNILRFNPVTGTSEIIFPLSDYGLHSAGDICFLNGYLYVSCLGNKIAKINLATKEFEVIKIKDPPFRDDMYEVGSFGMVTLGDGYLYISNNRTSIYKLDPNTGQATPFYDFDELDVPTTGFAAYPDICNAPGCRGEVKIEINSPQPFCSNTGVTLEAKGRGITNAPLYTWILPDKSTVEGQMITASAQGEYTVKYHQANDTCSITNSTSMDIIQHPSISLGNDTAICKNETYNLKPRASPGITNYLWQDGTLTSNYAVSDTGQYYVTASNTCGIAADTIHISYKPTPAVQLRTDTAVCQYSHLELHNLETNNFTVNYRWSTGETSNIIRAYQPGVYWLDVFGVCMEDKVRDSVVITRKIDDCECFLMVPNAFTPNSDGVNDRFMMSSECVVKGTLRIYNRWGELVCSTTDVLNGWNGMKGANVQPSGLYIYVVTYEYEGRPGVFRKNGTIHLIH